jgi:hypothetical protein
VWQIEPAGVTGLKSIANALNDPGVRTARRTTARWAISWRGRET